MNDFYYYFDPVVPPIGDALSSTRRHAAKRELEFAAAAATYCRCPRYGSQLMALYWPIMNIIADRYRGNAIDPRARALVTPNYTQLILSSTFLWFVTETLLS